MSETGEEENSSSLEREDQKDIMIWELLEFWQESRV